ncbi:hypothetical protein DFP72DRAFT_140181 [Ephemerocybe angulata]|uniref:Uncharacterized protein n=1 Tax=Ephemerocybe angulata TaxID=980116 RepID=A0A8H6LW01_9AGAR|nr:hypothetical protein DFP72DRAFT_140181 [Tulosesus angulatus]
MEEVTLKEFSASWGGTLTLRLFGLAKHWNRRWPFLSNLHSFTRRPLLASFRHTHIHRDAEGGRAGRAFPCKTRQTREIVGTSRQFETTRIEAFPAPPTDVLDDAFRLYSCSPALLHLNPARQLPRILAARFSLEFNYVRQPRTGGLQLAQRRRDNQHDDQACWTTSSCTLASAIWVLPATRITHYDREASDEHGGIGRLDGSDGCPELANVSRASARHEWQSLYVSNSHPPSLRPSHSRPSSCDALCAVQHKI